MVKYYCIVDFEGTCGRTVAKNQGEIIEIGAVIIDGKTFEPIRQFGEFVQPVLHPILDDFCTELTSITQEQVDGARLFPEVLKSFAEWLGDKNDVMFASWGNFDRRQFYKDCKLHNVIYPFNRQHLNIKRLFSAKLGENNQFSVKKALIRQQLKFEGTPHRGIDDAINIARIFKSIKGENGTIALIIDKDIAKIHKFEVYWKNSHGMGNSRHEIIRDLTYDEAIKTAEFVSELKGWAITNKCQEEE